MKKSKLNRNPLVFTILSTVFFVIYTLLIILPLIWASYSAFKTELDFSFNPIGLPSEKYGGWQFQNIFIALKILYVPVDTLANGTRYVYIQEMLLNTVLYATGCTMVSLFSHVITSYIVARFKFKGANFLYSLVIIVMALPIVGSLPAEIQMSQLLGTYDKMIGSWIMKGGFASMYFLIFYASFKSIPQDFNEAASLDGAGEFTICWKIILPMAKNTIIAVFLLMFINFWNDYYGPMVYLPTKPTIAYGLYTFQFSYIKYNTIPIRLLASFIVSIPIFILFMIFRNKIMGAVMIGGIKG